MSQSQSDGIYIFYTSFPLILSPKQGDQGTETKPEFEAPLPDWKGKY